MGAYSVLPRIFSNAFSSSLNGFNASSFDDLVPCFLQPASWNPRPPNPTFSLGPWCIRSSRSLSICAMSSQNGDDSLAALGHQNLKLEQKKLAVFVSGGGSNFKAIHDATINGSVLGDVVVLVTNKGVCGGAIYAKENGIPVVLFPNKEEQSSPSDLVATLRYSGPTVHFVDEEYDTGRILAQRIVPVGMFDTPDELAAKVLREEHRLYVDVVAALCEDRIFWRDDGVPLIQHKDFPQQYS